MISTKKFIVDGNTKSFLSEFIIKSIQHSRVYLYEYNSSCLTGGVEGTDICDTINSDGFFIRQFDAPDAEDLVTIDKYDLIDNRISFYNDFIPPSGLTLWIEVATSADEFSDVLATPAAIRAETAADNAEASAIRAEDSALAVEGLENQINQNTLDITTNTDNIGVLAVNDVLQDSNIQTNIDSISDLEIFTDEISETLFARTTISVADTVYALVFGEDNTDSIQSAIQDVEDEGGGIVYFPKGEYLITQLILPSNVILKGENQDSTEFIQIIGTNDDMIISKNFDTEDIKASGIVDLKLNGNYFTGSWNAPTGVYGNTLGGGLKLRGYGLKIDIQINNISGIGALFEEPINTENSSDYHMLSTVSIVGRDYGKEGIIIKGPNDWLLEKAFIGRAGILKRPDSDTIISTSTYYSGQPIDGIVLDGVNIEIGTLHVYANWSGTGFRTRNNVRLTDGGVIISESNRAQVYLSSGTYGSASLDIRNLSMLHPNWTGTIPTYNSPDSEWDGVTIDANDIDLDITCKRTITAPTRVVGSTSVVNNGSATINLVYSNSTAPVGDVEAGSLYSGDAIRVVGDSSMISAKILNCNGSSFNILGGSNKCQASIIHGIGGSAVTRNSLSNSKRGNIMEFSFEDCPVGFNSIGTPMAEQLEITYEYGTGGTVYTGDEPDLFRQQTWNINGSIANVRSGKFSTNNIETRGINYKGTELSTLLDNKEDNLGNPTNDGDVLTSTIAGIRSWTTVSGGTDLTKIETDVVPIDNGNKFLGYYTNYWKEGYINILHTLRIINDSGDLLLSGKANNKVTLFDSAFGNLAEFYRYGFIFNLDSGGYKFNQDSINIVDIQNLTSTFNNFLKRGELGIALKEKLVTGTTGAAQNDEVLVPHGLDSTKIESFIATVEHTTTGKVPHNSGITNYEFVIFLDGVNFKVRNVNASSGSILNKPIKILVTYKA